MKIVPILLAGISLVVASAIPSAAAADELQKGFATPPDSARPWCYWWWLNGAASKEGITRDFEQMKSQGIGGALLFDAGEAGAEAPRGPQFLSSDWRVLFKHAVREADRLGIVLSVNLCSGWNAGGPWVTPEHAAKKLIGVATTVRGPGRIHVRLPQAQTVQGFYRDIAVLASPVSQIAPPRKLTADSNRPAERTVWDRHHTVDLTKSLDKDGEFNWDVPAGTWEVLRIGYTLHGNMTKCVGSGPAGLEIDTMSAAAMDAHFAATGAKLIADAGPLAGKALQYFHIDSWELGQPTWTPTMPAEFFKRRGYDPLPYLPALLERTIGDPQITRRFLTDYHRTAADLVAANYYGRLRELTLKGGLRGTHPESGGPFFNHWIDALQCEGINDIPMGEFWKRNAEPTGPIGWPPQTNPTVKQIACASHTYGKPVCQAEAYTSFACDWIDDPWTMKDIGDEAFCHGLTRNVLCFWVHQPRLDVKPGYQWAHVGTHFDCNVTWWKMSHAWLTYLARCQHMLRQGLFVADFAYFQGEEIPAFISPRGGQQPVCPAGFDYDVLSLQVLLDGAAARDGKLILPSGMSYRYLVLPPSAPVAISPPALRKIEQLAEAGVTVVGPKPEMAPGLAAYPQSDREVASLADALWGRDASKSGQHRIGAGRVVWGCSLDEIVRRDALPPDVEFRHAARQAKLDWIHRRNGETEIYFLGNLSAAQTSAEPVFRVAGKQPELWDAVTGQWSDLPEWREENGRTVVPMVFEPRQSFFVVFRKAATSPRRGVNFPAIKELGGIEGPWAVSFDPKWGGLAQITFATLADWTQRPEEGIRYYSGTATYRRPFDLPQSAIHQGSAIYIDLGAVKNVAQVKVNGRDCGVVWTAPSRAEITAAVQPGANDLEIEVANLWPNRLIGNALLPKQKRLTTTNVRTYDTMTSGTWGCSICEARKKSGRAAALLPSGLLGPVRLLVRE